MMPCGMKHENPKIYTLRIFMGLEYYVIQLNDALIMVIVQLEYKEFIS